MRWTSALLAALTVGVGVSTSLAASPSAAVLRKVLPVQRGLVIHVGAADARLAGELARFLDQVHTERLSFDGLADLVPGDFAAHWQQTLEFLKVLTDVWPTVVADAGALDAAERRNRVFEAQAQAWRESPPADPVIAAGSTGSIPATADLLAVVAGLPRGAVVLPGLDLEATDAA